jgi:hypothetical protein
MYAKNVASLVALLAPNGDLELNFQDDIINAVVITANSEVRHAATAQRLSQRNPNAISGTPR